MDLTELIPSMTHYGPVLADTDITPRPTIWARFSTDLDPSQINTDVALNAVTILVQQSAALMIPVVFSDYRNRTLYFQPAQDLIPGETYQITLLAKLRSPAGRIMGFDRTWTFRVAPTLIGIPALLSPATDTALPVAGGMTFSWLPVALDPSFPSGSVVQYRVDLDTTPEFASIGSQGWTTLTVNTTATVGVSLPAGIPYFWRVIPQVLKPDTSVVPGPISQVRSLFWGNPADSPSAPPDPSLPESLASEALALPGATFGFPNGATNLPAWPLSQLTITFTAPIASGSVDGSLYFRREAVDDQPQTFGASVPLTWALSDDGLTLTITPSENLRFTNRYTLGFDGILELGGTKVPPGEAYFTSQYEPLYCSAREIRATFGTLFDRYSDDFINFHIFRASLDANRHYIRWFAPNLGGITALGGGPLENIVRSKTFQLPYAVERWVELETEARLLTVVLRELISHLGQRHRLADYEEETRAETLQFVESELRRIRKEQTTWSAEFSQKRAHARTGRKSERYPRYRDSMDWSQGDFYSGNTRGRTQL